MKYKYEMEIKLDHKFEVMYHTFNDLNKINEELYYIMNLEEIIDYKLITNINIYKL
mgnify:FL=1